MLHWLLLPLQPVFWLCSASLWTLKTTFFTIVPLSISWCWSITTTAVWIAIWLPLTWSWHLCWSFSGLFFSRAWFTVHITVACGLACLAMYLLYLVVVRILDQSKYHRLLRDYERSQQSLRSRPSLMPQTTVPPYWQCSSDSTNLEQDLNAHMHVDVTRTMKHPIEQLMNNTAIPATHGSGRDSHGHRFTRFVVTKVIRIENAALWRSYSDTRARLTKLSVGRPLDAATKVFSTVNVDPSITMLHHDAGEIFAFHGTEMDAVDAVMRRGFDERVGRESGMFGAGCYFAENSSKSDQYIGRGAGASASLHMFLCRVTMGRYFEEADARNGIKRPPCLEGHYDPVSHPWTATPVAPLKCGHERYDSIVALSKVQQPDATLPVFREFIVYDRSQCYPEYLISYERR